MRHSRLPFHLGTAILLATLPLACGEDPANTPPSIHLPPGGGIRPTGVDGHIPPTTPIFSNGGDFVFTGPTAPGSGGYTDAPFWDWDTQEQPPSTGTATYDVTL